MKSVDMKYYVDLKSWLSLAKSGDWAAMISRQQQQQEHLGSHCSNPTILFDSKKNVQHNFVKL